MMSSKMRGWSAELDKATRALVSSRECTEESLLQQRQLVLETRRAEMVIESAVD